MREKEANKQNSSWFKNKEQQRRKDIRGFSMGRGVG